MSKIKDCLLRLGAVYLRVVLGWFTVYFINSIFLEFVMRKYLLGISVLMSLDSLTACSDRSSCSSVSDGIGTTGKTLETGTTRSDGAACSVGTIAVPSSDSDLGITT
ncbi:MAG: hypothetical protein OSB08_04010, partial [SAR324 cluster bacterium]|nr:hypothetical protein [SAR324 cluster bacterium]